MEIYFLRHANAGNPKLDPRKDEQRPLDKQGMEQSHTVGQALRRLKLKPGAIISSPLVRARQTAEIVAQELGLEKKLGIDDALRPHASYAQFEQLLARHRGKDAIVIVGHRPSQTEFLNQLVTGDPNGAVDFKKGAVVRVDKEDGKTAVLKWSMPPKVVGALQHACASNSRPKTVRK